MTPRQPFIDHGSVKMVPTSADQVLCVREMREDLCLYVASHCERRFCCKQFVTPARASGASVARATSAAISYWLPIMRLPRHGSAAPRNGRGYCMEIGETLYVINHED